MKTHEVSEDLATVLEGLGYLDSEGLVSGEGPDLGARDRAWTNLRDRVGVEAVYFQDGAPVVAFTSESTGGLRALRQRLWNFGRVPLLIGAAANRVTVYNGREFSNAFEDEVDGVLVTANSRDLQILETFTQSAVSAGSFSSLVQDSNGTNTVERALLRNLAVLRSRSKHPESAAIAIDSAIGGAILARYLEDRQVLSSARVRALCGRPSVIGAFETGFTAVRALFDGLARHFNGDVFSAFSEAIPAIPTGVLELVGRLIAGDDLVTGQGSLWPYDFAVIPPDLISSIYEQLLETDRRKSAAYYTPQFLVDVVLDEVLPQNGLEGRPRVLDLACGSGAFLTEAFRRLVYLRGAIDNEKASERYRALVGILQSQIFGVDINRVAARITVFGLYLALLEDVDPPTLWEEVRLPRLLGINVLVADAFSDLGIEDFDIVVGNPPWASRLSMKAADYLRRSRVVVADNQIAEAFMWRALELLQPGGSLALVLPAKPVLHNRGTRAAAFRRSFFGEARVLCVIDLSAIRRLVFAEAIAPCAVIVAQKPADVAGVTMEPSDVIHLAVHPRPQTTVLGRLVITPEEVRAIPRGVASRPNIWKPLLWGDLRDVEMLDHLAERFPSLGARATSGKWLVGQGYQVGGGDAADASALRGMPNVPQHAVHPLFLDQTAINTFQHETLHRVRSSKMYKAPIVLAKRTLVNRRVAAVLVERDVTYSNALVGLSAGPEDLELLAAFAAAAVSSVGQYWFFHTAASWGVERDFIEVNEFKSLPLPRPSRRVADRLLFLQRAAQTGEPVSDEELDDIVFDLYELSVSSRARIQHGVTDGAERFAAGLAASRPVTADDLAKYRSVLHQSVEALLPDLRPEVVVGAEGAFAYARLLFHGAEMPLAADLPIADALANGHVSSPQNSGIVSQPSGIFLDGNVVHLVKTLDRDRWRSETAIEDVDRIIAMLATGNVHA